MPEYLSPGVYIEEVETGPIPIAGVSTSTGALIGLTQRGPVNVATLVTSSGAFRSQFGGAIPAAQAGTTTPVEFNSLVYAVDGFFQNGGTRLYVTRVAPSGGTAMSITYKTAEKSGSDTLTISAVDNGPWANVLFGVVSGRYQQIGGLRFTFANEVTAPIKVTTGGTANSATFVNVAGTLGLYVGAVLAWTKAGDAKPTDYGVVGTLSDKTITFNFALSAAPSAGDTLALVEFALTLDLLQNGAVAQTETFHNLNLNKATHRYVGGVLGAPGAAPGTGLSQLVRVALSADPDFATNEAHLAIPPGVDSGPVDGADGVDSMAAGDLATLVGGTDDDDPLKRTGMYTLKNIRGMLMIGMPGVTDVDVQSKLLALCENDRYKFAILDPHSTSTQTDWHIADASPTDVIAQRSSFDSKYGALYYPWLVVEDPNPANPNVIGTVNLPPSGHVMGIYARSDINRGVHKAPANEVVMGVVSFSHHVDQGTQDILNPLGINALRDFRAENRGLRVWGARTVSSNQEWKYVNIRRLFQYIEASIEYGTQWVVFEPNNELLWARVRQSVSDFLTDTWRTGALMGTKPSEAFYVHCDRTTMTQSDIENGRLIVEVGIAPTFPAEFVIFRISQWTGSAQGG
ncbi:MAG: phage tail sheath family protein [Candidatus Velthaea sp.]